jgi:hypothetical protein
MTSWVHRASTRTTANTDETRLAGVVSSVLAGDPHGDASARSRCLIVGCDVLAIGIAYCPTHRIMADDGTLWLRCVFDGGHAPVAPHDLLACPENRRQLDAFDARTPETTANTDETGESAGVSSVLAVNPCVEEHAIRQTTGRPSRVVWGREHGDIAVQDPVTGEWHELPYSEATHLWQAAVRRRR